MTNQYPVSGIQYPVSSIFLVDIANPMALDSLNYCLEFFFASRYLSRHVLLQK